MEKGTTNNPGGRPKGAKNKVGNEVREAIAKFVSGKFKEEEMNDLWGDLEARDRVKLLTELVKYVVAPATSEDVERQSMEGGRSFYEYLNKAAASKKQSEGVENAA